MLHSLLLKNLNVDNSDKLQKVTDEPDIEETKGDEPPIRSVLHSSVWPLWDWQSVRVRVRVKVEE